MFNRRGNFIGDSNPDEEERFDSCSECGQMMDMDRWLRYAQAHFPEEPVVVGQTWEQLTPLPFAPGADQQPAQAQTTYTLQGVSALD